MGVDTEGKSCVIVAQYTADGFHVHAVLEGQSCEGVSEIVESNMLQSSVLQYLLMEFYYRVGMVYRPCDRRGEHILVVGMLAVFLERQVDSVLWDGYLPYRGLRLGPGEYYLVTGVSCVQVGLEVLLQKRLHLHLLHFRSDAVIGGIAWDESFFYRSFESAARGEVDAPLCGAA